MEKEGVDLKKHPVEFMQYQPFLIGRGPETDLNGETTISGLYAVGNAVSNFRC